MFYGIGLSRSLAGSFPSPSKFEAKLLWATKPSYLYADCSGRFAPKYEEICTAAIRVATCCVGNLFPFVDYTPSVCVFGCHICCFSDYPIKEYSLATVGSTTTGLPRSEVLSNRYILTLGDFRGYF